MPFEDQPPSDDAAAGELPPELRALGDRLSAEAEALVRRYPASGAQPRPGALAQALAVADGGARSARGTSDQNLWPLSAASQEAPRASRRAPATWSIAAAASAAIVFVGFVVWRNFGAPDETVVQRATNEPSTVVAGGSAQTQNESQRSNKHTPIQGSASTNVVHIGHNLLNGLSGAEREAVLDLLENQPEHAGNLSL